MIHRISANKTEFRAIDFKPGLNVVLAKRTKSSSTKDTRNGLGKSLLLAMIDFCLGGDGKEVRIEPLREWSFTLDVTISGSRVQVTRFVENKNKIYIEGLTEDFCIKPAIDVDSGQMFYTDDQWNMVLGIALFGTPPTHQKYQPTLRSLFPYFLRIGQKAYIDPFNFFPGRKRWQNEVAVTYLLGLNWEHATRLEEYRVQEERLKLYAKYLKDEDATLGKLETDLINLRSLLRHDRSALDSFRVLPQYEQIEQEANELTSEIQSLVNQNITYKRRETQYRKAIDTETPPPENVLEDLYHEVGIVFPEGMKRTLEEARNFHRQILLNRQAFLQGELKNITQNIKANTGNIESMTIKRSELLKVLSEHGALAEWTILNDRYVKSKAEEERLSGEIQEIKDNESKIKDIKIARTELSRIAEQDKDERMEIWSEAVQEFNRLSQMLYKQPGELILDIDESGYQFDVSIGRGASDGVKHMKVFCFDAMLLKLWSQKGKIDFLLHDSIMFDPVDSRQSAAALEAISKITAESNAQYICTFNEDAFPFRECSLNSFDFKPFINPVCLTDNESSGCLCGFRFESQPLQKQEQKNKKIVVSQDRSDRQIKPLQKQEQKSNEMAHFLFE